MDELLARAYRRRDQERQKLETKGYSAGLANGATHWAFKMALHHAPPQGDGPLFLETLEHYLSRSENWARDYRRKMSE